MRQIRLAEGVFNKITGSNYDIPDYERFLKIDSTVRTCANVASHITQWKKLLTKVKPDIEHMSHLEDLIILYRIRENREIQLYVQREYIYVRVAVPRNDTKNQDFRVIVDKIEFYNTEDYMHNPTLLARADEIVCRNLDNLIEEKIRVINNFVTSLKRPRKKVGVLK
jgi:hypothetical protein